MVKMIVRESIAASLVLSNSGHGETSCGTWLSRSRRCAVSSMLLVQIYLQE